MRLVLSLPRRLKQSNSKIQSKNPVGLSCVSYLQGDTPKTCSNNRISAELGNKFAHYDSLKLCCFALYVLWSPDKDYYLPFSHRSMPDPWFCGSKYLSIPMWFIAIGRWMWNTSAINLPQRVYLYSTLTHFSISVKFGESTTTISLPPINSFDHSITYCNNNLNASLKPKCRRLVLPHSPSIHKQTRIVVSGI